VGTGEIIRMTLDATQDEIKGKTVWIQDDICDGGRTFIELAKLLRERGAAKVILSVSHAIISHGEEELKKWIDKIYTTDSIKNDESGLVKRYKLSF
jgi:ribose-phosphate pyrophosphokinase